MRLKLFLLCLILLATVSAQAQETTASSPDLTQAQAEIITGLTVTLNGLLLGGAIVLTTVIYALYNSVPPTFQTAFLEALRGVIAITEDTLKQRALDVKQTPSDLDDRILSAVSLALADFAKRFDKTPPDTL